MSPFCLTRHHTNRLDQVFWVPMGSSEPSRQRVSVLQDLQSSTWLPVLTGAESACDWIPRWWVKRGRWAWTGRKICCHGSTSYPTSLQRLWKVVLIQYQDGSGPLGNVSVPTGMEEKLELLGKGEGARGSQKWEHENGPYPWQSSLFGETERKGLGEGNGLA